MTMSINRNSTQISQSLVENLNAVSGREKVDRFVIREIQVTFLSDVPGMDIYTKERHADFGFAWARRWHANARAIP